jgi:UDP-N-acetylglucosamine 4-epimerase
LITGGAGFIGSNLVEYLINNEAGLVRVLDNLSNGYIENIDKFMDYKNFEFINGDIRDINTCKKAVEGINYVSHQAALGSVPRSIADPILTNEVNVGGFLNMLVASKKSNSLKRFVYAASSSTYGDSKQLPKIEGNEGAPLSPYAVTKAVNEFYADVFMKVYGFQSIGLRYFNVFGPKQSVNNPYAAVIPIFCNNFLNEEQPCINGDGETSRDFTYISNAVQANVKAFFAEGIEKHHIFNVACGKSITLNEIIKLLIKYSNKNISPIYKEERKGDVKHSLASIDFIKEKLNYKPEIHFQEGLKLAFEWYKKNKV